jgi:putative transcriptional regulator
VNELELTVEPPFFLVAMPQILDPFFHRAVVVMLEHHDEGSFGFIINRPTELSLAELLSNNQLEWRGGRETVAWYGGPVQPQMGTAFFSDRSRIAEGEPTVEIAEGLLISADSRTIERLASDPPSRFRLVLGHAGWDPGQLDQEMDRNDWLVVPFDVDLLFDEDAGSIWRKTLESIDVRPESLPIWSGSRPGSSN